MAQVRRGVRTSGAVDARHVAWAQRPFALARICLGFVFLWAFLDKNFGLGRPTPSGQGWAFGSGPDPSSAYLKGVKGPFAGMFHAMAGHGWVNWLFMLGLLGIGIGLITGLAFRFSAVCGIAMLAFLYASSLPLQANPFIDDHVIEALMLAGLILIRNGRTWGLSAWWDGTVGRRFPLLR
jgi:thiosulfate dehydrogenase [quinone] large subunit